jgi:pantetheine-phosphate adenylyltransferase
MKLAYTGSFDPWTKGHQSIVENILDRDPSITIEIIIAINPDKKYLFTYDERKEFIETELWYYADRIKVTICDGVVANYIYEQNINFIIRGIRNNNSDANDELQLARINSTLSGEPLTLIVPQIDPNLDIVSSSNLKLLNKFGLPLKDYASANIREKMRYKLTGKPFIGVTGGMACGKSTLCKKLATYDIVNHINMDELAHEIYESDLPIHKHIQQQIIRRFSLKNATINRQELGDIVFNDKPALNILTNMLLEPILNLLYKKVNDLPEGIVLIESAILVERNLTEIVDHNIILVNVSQDLQRSRLVERGLSDKQIDSRLSSQMDYNDVKNKIINIQRKEHNRLFIEYPHRTGIDGIDEIFINRYLSLKI